MVGSYAPLSVCLLSRPVQKSYEIFISDKLSQIGSSNLATNTGMSTQFQVSHERPCFFWYGYDSGHYGPFRVTLPIWKSQVSSIPMSCYILLLTGLQYITEFRDEDPSKDAQYVCQMCELSCNSGNVLAHILGIKHRMHYLVRTTKDSWIVCKVLRWNRYHGYVFKILKLS